MTAFCQYAGQRSVPLKINLQNKPWEMYWEEKAWRPALDSPLQLSGMVCDHFAESSSHHLHSRSIPYTSFFLTYMYVHTESHTRLAIGNKNKQSYNAGYAGCWKALIICSLVSCLLSAVRCVDKTKGSPGKCKFSCTNLARVTFSQISFFKMFPSMPQFNKIVKLCQKCKIKCIQYIVSFAWIFFINFK